MSGATDGDGYASGGGGGGAGGGSGGLGGAPGVGKAGISGTPGAGGTLIGSDGGTGGSGGMYAGGGGGGGGLNGTGTTSITDLVNAVTLTGGNGGSGGSTISNSSTNNLIQGGGGGGGGGAGGFGAIVTGTITNTNTGTIAGGNGGGGGASYNDSGSGGDGGAGLLLTANGASIFDAGTIKGGGGTSGGQSGYFNSTPGSPGIGGAGIIFQGMSFAATVTTSGLISGGVGGNSSAAANQYNGYGAQGGNGFIGSGGTINNSGSIAGGAGGNGGEGHAPNGGRGGDGIIGANLTIINGGLISGGQAGRGFYNVPNQGNAIDLTGGANILSFTNSNSGLDGNISIATSFTSLTFAQNSNSSLASTITGNGSVIKSGTGTLSLTGGSTYGGGTTVAAGTLELGAADVMINAFYLSGPAGMGPISFAGTPSQTATLALDLVAQPKSGGVFGNVLSAFGDNDRLDLVGLAFSQSTSAFYDTSKSQLTVTAGDTSETFNLTNTGVSAYYAQDDGNGGTLISDLPVCFASGTLIRTARDGANVDIAMDALRAGDIAVTASGAHRPIRWIGHRTLDCRRYPDRHYILPVRVCADAFGPARPARDLVVSPGHALCVDICGEVLIPAIALVNGTTILQEEVEHVTYWHVELEGGHDILLAENMPAESYLDMGNRGFFNRTTDSGTVVDLAAAPDADPALRSHADFCRPFHDGGPVVEAIREGLALRAQASGWTTGTVDVSSAKSLAA